MPAAPWSRTRTDLLSLREQSPVARRCRRAEPRPDVAELFNTPPRLAWPSTRTTCPARGAAESLAYSFAPSRGWLCVRRSDLPEQPRQRLPGLLAPVRHR